MFEGDNGRQSLGPNWDLVIILAMCVIFWIVLLTQVAKALF